MIRPWAILALLMLLSATNQFHRLSLPALDAEILSALSIEAEALGALKSAFLISYTILMAPGGWLVDRIGPRAALLLVTGGAAVFGSLCGAAGWLALGPLAAWWWLASARWGMGMLSAPLYPATSRMVGMWFDIARQPLANGLVTASAGLGMAAAPPVMAWLAARFGWEASFVIAGAGTLGILAVWAAFGREPGSAPRTASGTDATPPPRRPTPWGRFLRHRGVLCLTLAYSTVGYFEYLLFYWLGYYLDVVLGLPRIESAEHTGRINLAFLVMTPLGGLASGWFVRRWGLRRGFRILPMAAMGLAAAFLAAAALSGDLTAKLWLLALALGCVGASEGPFWTAAVMLGGPLGATSSGLVNTGGNLLGALAPIATPVIARWANDASGLPAGAPLGWTVSLLAGSILCLVGMLFWMGVAVDRPLEAE